MTRVTRGSNEKGSTKKSLIIGAALLLSTSAFASQAPMPSPHGNEMMPMPPGAQFAQGVVCDTPAEVKDYMRLVDEEHLKEEDAVKQINASGKNEVGEDPCARNRWLLIPGEKGAKLDI